MFDFLKKKFSKEKKQQEEKKEQEHVSDNGFDTPKWYEIGEDNPFDQPILDIRSVTLNIVATTKEKAIAENYNSSRSDDGKRYIGTKIPNGKLYKSNLRYPHNGDELKGIVYKADSMDVKWDIYVYDDWFYFTRSWTSELIYKVHYANLGDALFFDEIETAQDSDGIENLHEQNINSLLLTHVMGRVWPFVISKSFEKVGEKEIALNLFSRFGNKATIATHADTLTMKLIERETE